MHVDDDKCEQGLRDLAILIAAVRRTGHLAAEPVVVQVADGYRVAGTDPLRHDDRGEHRIRRQQS